ncbi:hypothetical protein BCR44DRAFT_305255 [Catenaria anguillulae PL171]|uniref:Uncharacterized protein n=1 Tax=Catenaria anguillulae PL171 TaxID=765915 RepID=A0A1Y2I384_9FUNG|nr:hypothetical protein BCR44DRAFT_305255 [Catenaria anguillulae PL171]
MLVPRCLRVWSLYFCPFPIVLSFFLHFFFFLSSNLQQYPPFRGHHGPCDGDKHFVSCSLLTRTAKFTFLHLQISILLLDWTLQECKLISVVKKNHVHKD